LISHEIGVVKLKRVDAIGLFLGHQHLHIEKSDTYIPIAKKSWTPTELSTFRFTHRSAGTSKERDP
jgi:hypothetical protein